MGKNTGFIEIERVDPGYETVNQRIKHFREFLKPLPLDKISNQGARCMDCGIPYCHQGCPVNNIIPEWNDLVYKSDWRRALEVLHSTNNFPEFTGRICPAPCEEACTLNINQKPVTIKNIECSIIDYGWEKGWIKPEINKAKTNKKVAIIGSGPSGLACAQQLARAGHKVVVYEKNSRIGGLLRIGIPDFKMEKHLIDRRISQMEEEGVEFKSNINVGVNISFKELINDYDALAICMGSEYPRDLSIPGRDLSGVYFAMEFLSQQNNLNAGEKISSESLISAQGKNVLVIGGGDTGSDCVGTSIRQGANTVRQIELLSEPPKSENKLLNWPNWPMKLRTSSSHQEGCIRSWSLLSKSFEGSQGKVSYLKGNEVEWLESTSGGLEMKEKSNGSFKIEADLILLAMGFLHVTHDGLVKEANLKLDPKGNLDANDINYETSIKKVFSAGDSRRGQSLVVWAIKEGQECAKSIDRFLMSQNNLA